MSKRKINVGILFGGRSAEHEVSLQSAKNVLEAIDRKKYNPILIGIDKSGHWLLSDQANFLLNSDNPKLIKLNTAGQQVALAPQSQGQLSDLNKKINAQKIDVIFPILHGTFGEDGTVQGLLKLADIPFVGAGVLGSAIGMDKDVMKRLLKEASLPIGKFVSLKSNEKIPAYTKIKNKLGKIIFIKPANAGSSIGISKVKQESQYLPAIKNAFSYDNKIIFEEYIVGREIECSVLGNDKVIASLPGEVIANDEFYSYEAKYINANGAKLDIPAKLPQKITQKIQTLAIETFKTLNCEGLARVDFFLKKNNDIIINEINTIPGFTKISMYPKLWELSGISYTELIDRLIQLAIERFVKENKLKTNYK
ncbi:D-alanine--D-alanine ligase [Candidatus Parcubacteria bacterium]|nr:MAG: D-alanine--D-alanine ligase [Candidatus Parcubacteria bacterium]